MSIRQEENNQSHPSLPPHPNRNRGYAYYAEEKHGLSKNNVEKQLAAINSNVQKKARLAAEARWEASVAQQAPRSFRPAYLEEFGGPRKSSAELAAEAAERAAKEAADHARYMEVTSAYKESQKKNRDPHIDRWRGGKSRKSRRGINSRKRNNQSGGVIGKIIQAPKQQSDEEIVRAAAKAAYDASEAAHAVYIANPENPMLREAFHAAMDLRFKTAKALKKYNRGPWNDRWGGGRSRKSRRSTNRRKKTRRHRSRRHH